MDRLLSYLFGSGVSRLGIRIPIQKPVDLSGGDPSYLAALAHAAALSDNRRQARFICARLCRVCCIFLTSFLFPPGSGLFAQDGSLSERRRTGSRGPRSQRQYQPMRLCWSKTLLPLVHTGVNVKP